MKNSSKNNSNSFAGKKGLKKSSNLRPPTWKSIGKMNSEVAFAVENPPIEEIIARLYGQADALAPRAIGT